MHLADAGIHQAPASHGKDHAAGGDKIAVEHFEKRKQRRRQNHADNPARAHRTLEGHRRHEFLAGEFPPGSHITHGGDHDGVKKNAHQDRHPDRLEKIRPSEIPDCDSSAPLTTDSNPVMK